MLKADQPHTDKHLGRIMTLCLFAAFGKAKPLTSTLRTRNLTLTCDLDTDILP